MLSKQDLELILERGREVWLELAGNRLFITGGTGFFGIWLLSALQYANHRLGIGAKAVVLTRHPEDFVAHAPVLADDENIDLCSGDVRSFMFPAGRFDRVIHAAADTGTQAAREPGILSETIVAGTRRVLEFARQAGVKQLLFVSSGAVYGEQPAALENIPESFAGAPLPHAPGAAYGLSKRLAEHLCIAHQREFGIEVKIARCFAFVGPYLPLDTHFAIGNLIADALAGRPLEVRSDGTSVRTYLYAADLAVWLWTILVKGHAGRVYNVGSSEVMSIAALARTVAAELAPACAVKILGETADGRRSRYVPETSRAREELGLESWTTLAEGIQRTAQWARARNRTTVARGEQQRTFKTKTFVVDIDGVVATLTDDNDYTKAQPIAETIAALNRLYAMGHRIVMFTARGYVTGIDWRQVTQRQLAKWGLQYHELHLGKPAADHYVDDRFISIDELQRMSAACMTKESKCN